MQKCSTKQKELITGDLTTEYKRLRWITPKIILRAVLNWRGLKMRWSIAAVALSLVAVASAGFIPTGQRAVGDIKYGEYFKAFALNDKLTVSLLRQPIKTS